MDSSKMDQIRQGLLSLKWGQSPGMTQQSTPLEKQDSLKNDQKASDLVHMTKGRAHPRSRRPPKQVSQTSETKSAASVSNDKDHSMKQESQVTMKEDKAKLQDTMVKSTQQPKSASSPAMEPIISMENKPDFVQERKNVDQASLDEKEEPSGKEEQKDSEEAEEKKTLENIKGSVLKNKSRFEQIDTSASKESHPSASKEPAVRGKVLNEKSHFVSAAKLDETTKPNRSSEEKVNALSVPKQRAPIETPSSTKVSPLASHFSSKSLLDKDKDKDKNIGRNPKILELKKRIASLQQDTTSSHESLSKLRSASSVSLPSTKTPNNDSTVRQVTPQSHSDAVKVIPNHNEDLIRHSLSMKTGELSSFAPANPTNEERAHRTSLKPAEAKETGKDEATTPLRSRVPELNQFTGPNLACSEALLSRWKREKQQSQANDTSATNR
ncbi:hypothetical protein SOMG_03270 [Schizosaccharomyces osmophilus]|uniref:Uncharacterized protein n=1 Tax=Schizosaccharomyces osmophilus TaxID=2545709 RepID=A0AAE9WCI5_9SCHI|nr:uncharacterized protein SOMG_03270 [Schizosaccharomyces osmophilus]WBW73345.1 hypothetical protein SOMG_03270 [Schizosaccharomyces osmophilus]